MTTCDFEGVILNGTKKVGTFRVFDFTKTEIRDIRIFRHLVKNKKTKTYHLMMAQVKPDSAGYEEIVSVYQDFGYGRLSFKGKSEEDGEYLKFSSAAYQEAVDGYLKEMLGRYKENS
jgi:hypothetical protein